VKLLVVGCSFIRYNGWPNLLPQDQFEIVDLSLNGCGNRYIADATFNYLLTNAVDAVVVSWSGLTRLDKIVDRPEQFADYYYRNTVNGQTYISSGGAQPGSSWQQYNLARLLFESDYKFLDKTQYGYLSLMEILKLQNFLKLNNITYYFTSYVNYWGKEDRVIKSTPDFHLRTVPELESLINQIDFDRFLFVSNDQPKTIQDFAIELNSFDEDGFHPGTQAKQHFVDQLLPVLSENMHKE